MEEFGNKPDERICQCTEWKNVSIYLMEECANVPDERMCECTG